MLWNPTISIILLLVFIFFHSVWDILGCCYDKWFFYQNLNILHFILRLWILFKPSALTGFSWPCFARGKRDFSPHYYLIEIEVQVPHLVFCDTWGRRGSLLLLQRDKSSSSPRGQSFLTLQVGESSYLLLGIKVPAPYLAFSDTTSARGWHTLL